MSIGAEADFPNLLAAPFEIRRRWINYPDLRDLDAIGAHAFGCYLAVSLEKRIEEPLVSIFTPTYRTGDRFLRTYASVRAQTYPNWEWVIWDDSDDDGATFAMLKGRRRARSPTACPSRRTSFRHYRRSEVQRLRGEPWRDARRA